MSHLENFNHCINTNIIIDPVLLGKKQQQQQKNTIESQLVDHPQIRIFRSDAASSPNVTQ